MFDWALLVSNMIILFAVTGGAHYLLVSIRRYDAAERDISRILKGSSSPLPNLSKSLELMVEDLAQVMWGRFLRCGWILLNREQIQKY